MSTRTSSAARAAMVLRWNDATDCPYSGNDTALPSTAATSS